MRLLGMANQAFTTPATNPIAAQPAAASHVYLRSTSASDTMSASVYGTISAAPDVSTVTLVGKREVLTADQFTAISQGILASGPVGIVRAYSLGTAGTGDITGLTNPSDGATLTIGLTGLTQDYRFKNTLAAAYDVKIGATVADTMANLKAAINADGTPGTEYYTGTLANPYLSATVSTTVVTVTDRIACNRLLDWSFAQSAANFALRSPSEGADGTLLFSFAAGITNAANRLTFSTEDHLTTTLPALMLGTSNHVNVNGVAPMLRLWSDQAVTYKIQASTDLINWTDTSEGAVALSASTMTYVHLAARADYIRFVITANANTTNSICDFRVIY